MDKETFDDKLVKLAEASTRISLAAAKAITRSGNASAEMRRVVAVQVDQILEREWSLQKNLDALGQK